MANVCTTIFNNETQHFLALSRAHLVRGDLLTWCRHMAADEEVLAARGSIPFPPSRVYHQLAETLERLGYKHEARADG